MRLHLAVIFGVVVSMTACKKDSDSSSSGGGASEAPTDSASASATDTATTEGGDKSLAQLAGSVLLDIEPKDGAAETTVAGAVLTVEGHPELKAVADAGGVVSLGPVLPGSVNLMVLSGGGASLTTPAAKYGLRFTDVVVTSGKPTDLGQKPFKETGSITGVAAFYTNPNDLDVLGTEAFIPGTPFLIKTGSDGKFTMAGVPEGTYTVVVQHTGFAVLKIEDVKVLEGKTTDLGTTTLSLSTGPEGGIAVTANKTVTFSPSNVMKISTSRDVQITLNYDRDAALMKVSDEPAFLNKAWEPVAKTKSWHFDTDGKKSLYVMYSDLNGLESSPFSAEIVVDTLPPKVSSIALMYGFAQSAVSRVPVTILGADDGSGIATISFDGDVTAGTKASPKTVGEGPVMIDLTSGNGPRLVTATVTDYAGNTSTEVFDDVNVLDGNQSGGGTLITFKTYEEPVILKKTEGPFLMQLSATFMGGLTIEPGTELRLAPSISPYVKSKFVADGTSEAIHIKREPVDTTCGTGFAPNLTLNGADPGVSNSDVIKNVVFQQVSLQADGGLVENATFDSSACPANVTLGKILKTGLDTLTIKSSHFRKWDVALEVDSGDGNARMVDNTDSNNTVGTALRQRGSGKNTVFTNNVFKGIRTEMYRGVIEPMNNEPVNFSGSTFSTDGVAVHLSSQVPVSLTVSGLTFTSCGSVATVDGNPTANPDLTINRSTFS